MGATTGIAADLRIEFMLNLKYTNAHMSVEMKSAVISNRILADTVREYTVRISCNYICFNNGEISCRLLIS